MIAVFPSGLLSMDLTVKKPQSTKYTVWQHKIFLFSASAFNVPPDKMKMQLLEISQGIDKNGEQISVLSRNLKSAANCNCMIVLRKLIYLSC